MKLSPKKKQEDKFSKSNPQGAGRRAIDVEALCIKLHKHVPKALPDIKLCQALGISKETFYKLKKRNEDFREVLDFYSDASTIAVLKSFKKIACGFSMDEVTKERVKDSKTGKYSMITTKVVTKYYAPNADAAFKYLKNRDPENFKDRVETDHTFSGGAMDNVTFIIKGKD